MVESQAFMVESQSSNLFQWFNPKFFVFRSISIHMFIIFPPFPQLNSSIPNGAQRESSSVLGLWRSPGATAGSRHRDPPGPAVLRTERWDSQPCPGGAMGRASDRNLVFFGYHFFDRNLDFFGYHVFVTRGYIQLKEKKCGTLFLRTTLA